MDFGRRKVAKVTKIGTQGRYHVSQWVTEYIVSYSIDGGYFHFQLHKHYIESRVRTKLCVKKISKFNVITIYTLYSSLQT